MSAKIPHIIPAQQYEVVREQIGAILYTELDNQEQLTYDQDLFVKVWVERSVPFDKEEVPCVNVCLMNGEYDNKDSRQVDGTYEFAVDCYAKAKALANGTVTGDILAQMKLQKLMGICRAILENPIYKTLGFIAPSLSRVMVRSMTIRNEETNDTEHIMMGRLILSVRVVETVRLQDYNLLEGFDTAVKMSLTDKGYVFSGDTPYIPPDTCEPVLININDEYFASIASGATRNIPIEYASGGAVPVLFEYGTVIVPDPGSSLIWGSLWP